MRYITYGFLRILQRPGLTLLLYAVNTLASFFIALNMVALTGVVNSRGFSQELATRFNIVLWADILEKAGASLDSAFMQLFWLIPVYLVWKVASSAGLIHAFQHGETNSFWKGVATYSGQALLLSVGYLVPLGILLIVELLIALGLQAIWPGEVATYRIYLLLLPALIILTVWLLQLLHDFGRVALISGRQRVWDAWKTGMTWPFKHRQAFLLVLFWSILAAGFLALPFLIDPPGVRRPLALWGLFLFYQILFILRAAITVGWTATEVFFFEDRAAIPQTPVPPVPLPDHAPDSGQSPSEPDKSVA